MGRLLNEPRNNLPRLPVFTKRPRALALFHQHLGNTPITN